MSIAKRNWKDEKGVVLCSSPLGSSSMGEGLRQRPITTVSVTTNIHKYLNIQMYKCTNVQMYKCTNVQMYKSTNIQIWWWYDTVLWSWWILSTGQIWCKLVRLVCTSSAICNDSSVHCTALQGALFQNWTIIWRCRIVMNWKDFPLKNA